MFMRVLNILIGVWLILAPRVLDYASVAARTNETWIGLAVIATTLVSFRVPEFIYVNIGYASWLVLAPILLRYGYATETANSTAFGILLLVFSGLAGARAQIAEREARERAHRART